MFYDKEMCHTSKKPIFDNLVNLNLNINQLINFRRQLHSKPELSGSEKETSSMIIDFLKCCNPDEIISGAGIYGVIATWDSKFEGDEIIFRSELDALPIQEINDFDYKSLKNGISHKCGHDGHSTILCGVAQYLSFNRPRYGKVRLLFQSSEETGEGARLMLEDDKFKNIKPDYIFALHNLPGYKINEVVIKEKSITAAVNSIIIKLKGRTSHAAEPEHGINPALAVSEILKNCLLMNNNNPDDENMRVITPVFAQLGEKAYGVSAGDASVHFTLRCWNDISLKALESSIEKVCGKIALDNELEIEFDYTQTFHASVNNSTAVDLVKRIALDKGYKINEKKYPFKWGEDFGLFTSIYKGCLFGLGSGLNIPELHNPNYDFPDEIIETGVNIFTGIIEEKNF